MTGGSPTWRRSMSTRRRPPSPRTEIPHRSGQKERKSMSSLTIFVGGGMAFVLFVVATGVIRCFRKAGPNEAFIIYGMRGMRVVKGGGAFIFPIIDSYRSLSLDLMSFDVAPQQNLYTRQGVAVTVEAVAQIKVKSDDVSVQTASEQFLTNTPQQREGLSRLVM